MKRTFISTSLFDKSWSKMGLTDNELRELENYLLENPSAGNIIKGTGGATKLRWALPDTGKRGGLRIIYIDVIMSHHLYFLLCYPKAKQESLTNNEKSEISAAIHRIIENEREMMNNER